MSNEKIICIEYCCHLPFIEDWNTGSFDPNLWTADEYWSVDGQYGYPAPCAVYENWPDTAYRQSLISYGINCRDCPGTSEPYIDGEFYLEFEIQLNDFTMSGTDLLTIEITDSIEWQVIHEFSNAGGSFPWEFHKINITDWAKGKFIKIAFVAKGVDGTNIHSWYVDNIQVYRECNPPLDLHWVMFDTLMAWSPPLPHTLDKRNGNRELLGYNSFDYDYFIGFTTDTFYYFDVSAGYGPLYVAALYEDCSPISNLIYGPTGVIEKQFDNNIKIYPNPAKDKINIRSDKPIDRIQIFNSQGRLILDREYLQNLISISLNRYPEGMYFINIFQDEVFFNRKTILIK